MGSPDGVQAPKLSHGSSASTKSVHGAQQYGVRPESAKKRTSFLLHQQASANTHSASNLVTSTAHGASKLAGVSDLTGVTQNESALAGKPLGNSVVQVTSPPKRVG